MLIRLADRNDNPAYLDPESIDRMHRFCSYTQIDFKSGGSWIYIKETPDEIMDLIREAEE